MQLSAQQHYDFTRRICLLVTFAMLLSIIVAWGYWNWSRWLELNLLGKIILVMVTIFIIGWLSIILGSLLLEIVRQLTSAKCSHCQGKTRYVPNSDAWSKHKVTYLCEDCGQVDFLTSRYSDEALNVTGGDGGAGGSGGSVA